MASSSLCKKVEGTVFPLMILMHAVEDGKDDPVDAGDVSEADRGPGTAPHFDKATLDHVGNGHFAPKRPREAEKGQQFRQVPPPGAKKEAPPARNSEP